MDRAEERVGHAMIIEARIAELEKRRQEIDTEIAGLREEQARADRDRKVELWIADRLEAIAADIRNREACVHSLEIDSGRSTVMVNGWMAELTFCCECFDAQPLSLGQKCLDCGVSR